MRLPAKPESIDELRLRLSSGELQESRSLEFKREMPANNKALAKQLAGLAAEGGALAIGVEETPTGSTIRPLDCSGARERVEQIARDIPQPAVHIESHILDSEIPGHGVLWIEIPASPAMLHQVDGIYYERGDTQTRPMADSDVADRMALRKNRNEPVRADLDAALRRAEPGGTAWPGRTCIVARPVGASDDELYAPTQSLEKWSSFAREVIQPSGMVPVIANRYWGILKSTTNVGAGDSYWPGQMFGYRDIEFNETGAFSHLSYCPEWLSELRGDIFAYGSLIACRETVFVVKQIQRYTGQRRMWDLAFSVSNVQGRKTGGRSEDRKFPARPVTEIPRDTY